MGTGKTASFVLGCLHRIDYKLHACQVLILVPTYEIGQGILKLCTAFADYCNVKAHCFSPRNAVRDDIAKLQSGLHIAVGTPGHIYNMISLRRLRVDDLLMFVLDEADEILSRGFKDHIYDILKTVPPNAQVCSFSASMPPEIVDLTSSTFMRDVVRIQVRKPLLPLDGMQFYVAIENEERKLDTLCDLFETLTIPQAIIYCNTLHTVNSLADQLKKRDFTISVMHKELEQKERDLVMREFLSGSTRMLIATNFLANSTDVQRVSLLINFDLPQSFMETYILRRIVRQAPMRKYLWTSPTCAEVLASRAWTRHVDEKPLVASHCMLWYG